MKDNSKLHIQIRNSSDKSIRVWMDDLPFCPKKLGRGEINAPPEVKKNCGVYQNENPGKNGKWRNDWNSFIEWALGDSSVDDNLIPRFYNIKPGQTPTDLTNTIKDNYYDLNPGEIFKITPPHDRDEDRNNMFIPQMCFYQPGDSDDISNTDSNVGGTEAHIQYDDKEYQYNCGGAGLCFYTVLRILINMIIL